MQLDPDLFAIFPCIFTHCNKLIFRFSLIALPTSIFYDDLLRHVQTLFHVFLDLLIFWFGFLTCLNCGKMCVCVEINSINFFMILLAYDNICGNDGSGPVIVAVVLIRAGEYWTRQVE